MLLFSSSRKYLFATIGVLFLYLLIFSYISFWKYYNLEYNELDLAIFSQTVYNTANGDWFANTIQNQNYLGDHFPPLLVLLVPFYYIFQHPLTLVFIQLFSIAIGGLILFFLSKDFLKKESHAFFFVILYILNFSIQSIGLFGFHMLPFIIPLFFTLLYFYQKKSFWLYILMIFLCLFVREDVSLLIMSFAFVPLLEKRSLRWWIVPFIAGGIYFFIALKIISFFNVDGGYKFFIYYGWLGHSLGEIVVGLFTNFFTVLRHVLSLGSFELVIGLFLPFCFLSFYGWRYLIPLIIPFAVQALQSGGADPFVLNTHYSAIFLPGVFMATLYGFKSISNFKYFNLVSFILLLSTVYSVFLLGPLPLLAREVMASKNESSERAWTMLRKIPKDSSVVASGSFLPELSLRPNVYSFHYIFSGKKQFSAQEYVLPDDISYLLVDLDEFKIYEYQVQQSGVEQPRYWEGDALVRAFIEKNNFVLTEYTDRFVLFERNANPALKKAFYDIDSANRFEENVSITDNIGLLSYKFGDVVDNNGLQSLDLTFTLRQSVEKKNYWIEFKNDGFSAQYQLGHGFFPVHAWTPAVPVTLRYWIPKIEKAGPLMFNIFESSGLAYFNYYGGIELQETARVLLGSFVLN